MILAIKYTDGENSLALYQHNKICCEYFWCEKYFSKQNLLVKIDDLLKKNSLSINDICAVAVWRGPGSYTGLRVAAGIANAMAWTLGIPIVGIKSKKPLTAYKIAKAADKSTSRHRPELKYSVITPVYSYSK